MPKVPEDSRADFAPDVGRFMEMDACPTIVLMRCAPFSDRLKHTVTCTQDAEDKSVQRRFRMMSSPLCEDGG